MSIRGFTMRYDAEPGAKVVFLFPWNGYPYDTEKAAKFLTVGETYTVKRTHPSQSSTAVELIEVPGEWFNSVQFADADRLPTLTEYIEILQPSVEYCAEKASAKAHAAALTWLAGQVEAAETTIRELQAANEQKELRICELEKRLHEMATDERFRRLREELTPSSHHPGPNGAPESSRRTQNVEKQFVKLTVEMEVTEPQAMTLMAMFEYWNHLASIGASRNVAFYVDGDGNFKPKCKVTADNQLPELTDVVRTVAVKSDRDGNRVYDFDGVAWAMHGALKPGAAEDIAAKRSADTPRKIVEAPTGGATGNERER